MVDAQVILDQAKEQRQEKQELLRPVAEFFHNHEGELFERYEAVDELVTDDSISSSDERMLHRVVGNLASDRVDPVQNVVRDDAKYVGVLDYAEHDYWYEYTEVNDVHGRMNVGVCAQCVKEADSDAEVARGCGTTEELADRIEQHYSEEHNESPSEIETGATLVSGTTISGNTAIHTGNDGQGSGLDADQFRGIDGSGLINSGTSYSETLKSAGKSNTEFNFPEGTHADGIGITSDNSLWMSTDQSIYEVDNSGSTISQFTSPCSNAEGVGADSDDCLWIADVSASVIHETNLSGTIQTTSPIDGAPTSVGVDEVDSIWYLDASSNYFYRMNQSGSVITDPAGEFSSPTSDSSGVDFDSGGSMWTHEHYITTGIYELNKSGSVIRNFSTPSEGSGGLGVDTTDTVWYSDEDTGSIYSVETSDKVKYE